MTRSDRTGGLHRLSPRCWRLASNRRWGAALLARLVVGVAMALMAQLSFSSPVAAGWLQHSESTFQDALSIAAPANAIAKTPDGFMWLGMQDGLFRWDGYHKKAYSADPSVPGSLPSPDILALHVDRRGTLWVGTYAGLARYDPAADRFDVPFATPSVLNDGYIRALAEDGDGHLWAGTPGGLELIDLDTLQVHPHAQYAGPAGLPAGLIETLLVDRQDRLWVVTPQGLYVKPVRSGRFERVALPGTSEKRAPVSALAEDAGGRIWVATASLVYVIPDGIAARIQRLSDFLPEAAALINDHGARSICEARAGEVWIATDHAIVEVDTQRRTARRAVHVDLVTGSLPGGNVYVLYRDPGGLVWVGLESSIAFSVVEQQGLRTLWSASDDPSRPAYSDVSQLLVHPDDTLWMGLAKGGVEIVSLADGTRRQLAPDDLRPRQALPASRVRALAPGSSGTVYIGTNRGLYAIDTRTAVLSRIPIPGRSDTDAVLALSFHGRSLWLGDANGLWELEQAGPGAMQLKSHLDSEQVMGHNVNVIYPDDDGRTLWVGAGSSLMSVDVKTLTVRRLEAETAGGLGIPKGHVTSMLKDLQGRLWVGFYGLGIRILDLHELGGPRVVRRVTRSEGLPHDGINQMLLDDAGDVWTSTDMGLARIGSRDLDVTGFNAADGLGDLGYRVSVGVRTAGGLLAFGGINELTVVDPQAIDTSARKVSIAVTDVRAGDAENAATLRVKDGQLTIGPDQRGLMVEYAVLDFTAPGESRYEYRLRGLDKNWKTTSASRRLAAYTNVPPGDYVLELRGADRRGHASASIEIAVKVRPAWYETIWLKLGAAFVVFAGIFMFLHMRTMLSRQREQELHLLVDQRTQQLQASQKQLEQLAYFDPLTSLGNRRLFSDELRRLLAIHQRDGGSFALLLIDLDRFKPLNDTHGHDAGDAVLVATARRMQDASREGDRVARLGGDEFAILLEGIDTDDAIEAARRRVAQSLEPTIAYGHLALQVSASFGAALFPRDGGDEASLFKAADVALYRMKNQGRTFDPPH